jgi:hypothetical protein
VKKLSKTKHSGCLSAPLFLMTDISRETKDPIEFVSRTRAMVGRDRSET